MPDPDDRLARLAEQEARLQFDRFGHEEAWDLGSRLVALARERAHPVVIGVDLGEQAVFRAGLPGSLVGTVGVSGLSSDQDHDLVVEVLEGMLGGDA